MARSRARCFQCHRPPEVCGPLSRKRALCEECAIANMYDNWLALTGKSERAHAEWRARWLDGCGQFGRPVTPYPPDA